MPRKVDYTKTTRERIDQEIDELSKVEQRALYFLLLGIKPYSARIGNFIKKGYGNLTEIGYEFPLSNKISKLLA